jgi:Arc/MetJ-type ribon-helix-helix transcriptional regulator
MVRGDWTYTAGMELTITPEIEGVIQRKVASGEYATAQQALESAVKRLDQDASGLEGWSAAELQAMVDEGLWSAENEPLMTLEEVRSGLAELRAARHRG